MAADDEAAREEPPLGLTVAHLETAYHQTHIAVYGSEAAELAGTSYLQREDIEMNPADVSVQRLALRFTREVREVLDAFWQAALMHERVYRMKHSGNTQLPTAMDRDMYCALHRRIHAVLMDEDEDECEASVVEDWHHDSLGEALIAREAFEDGLFELAGAIAALR